ncbi:hypothetical protein WJX72_009267 [[Myrmecia] bisecta]|uniref:SET and MYND domain-containing protein 4 n=1 Tax=[Myrmecia] bisecta TaxID=41462 RepID=A0AAW1P3X4_9CHLO
MGRGRLLELSKASQSPRTRALHACTNNNEAERGRIRAKLLELPKERRVEYFEDTPAANKAALLALAGAGGPIEEFVPALLDGLKQAHKEMVQQVKSSFEGVCDTLLSRRLTSYRWEGNEASDGEVAKGKRWLTQHVCPPSTVVIPLIGILRWIIGAYEAMTTTFLGGRGIFAVWPQAVLEALALNYLANRSNGAYFIPAARGEPALAVRYMKYLLQQTKEALEAGLQGGAGPSDESVQVSAPLYQLTGRGAKRHPEAEEAADEAEDVQEDVAMDADTAMQAAENAYHLDLAAITTWVQDCLHAGKEDYQGICKAVSHRLLACPLYSPALEQLCGPDVQGVCADVQVAYAKKAEATQAFKQRDYSRAADLYTESLAHCDETSGSGASEAAKLYCNRALCWLRTTPALPDLAVLDCSCAIACDAAFSKAWYRRAQAHRLLGDITQAQADAAEALRLVQAEGMQDAGRVAAVHEVEGLLAALRDTAPRPESTIAATPNGGASSSSAVSPAIAVERTQSEGRFLVAGHDLRPGDPILTDRPVAAVLQKRLRKTHCAHCLQRLGAGTWRCRRCLLPRYCSPACRDAHAHQPAGPECSVPWTLLLPEQAVLAARIAHACHQETAIAKHVSRRHPGGKGHPNREKW